MKNTGYSLIELLITIAIIGTLAVIVLGLFAPAVIGVFPFGPKSTVLNAKVERLYVDYSGGKEGSSSHYMVGTDKGVFEVNNSLWLWIWNADEAYSSLSQGQTYNLNVKGRKVVNFLFQEYPGIVSVEKTNQ